MIRVSGHVYLYQVQTSKTLKPHVIISLYSTVSIQVHVSVYLFPLFLLVGRLVYIQDSPLYISKKACAV